MIARVKDGLRKLRRLYGLLGADRRAFWISIALLLGQAAWSGVVLTALAVFLQTLTQAGGLAGAPAAHPALDLAYRALERVPAEQRPVWGFLAMGASMALGSLIETGVQAYTSRFSIDFICRLREDVFDRLLRNRLSFHDDQKKGVLLQMLIPEVRSCYSVFKTLLNIAVDGFQVAVYGACAAALSPRLTVVVVAVGAAMLAVNRLFSSAVKRMSARSIKARERLMVAAEESLGGVKQVKLLDLYAPSEAAFASHNRDAEGSNREIAMLLQWQDAVSTILGVASIAVLIAMALRWRLLSLPSLMVFLYALNQLTGSLKGAASRFNLFLSSLPSVDRVSRFLDEAKAGAERSGGVRRPRLIAERIAFEDVGLDYGARADALRGVSLIVPRGRTVALVGPSGAGKTSIANLLVRLYDATRGRITFDGTPIEELDLAWLRGRVGLVNQEPLLFNVSVRENLRMARPSATDAELESAAREAGAEEFIRELPAGWDTPVGDRGVKLSGGQKQRLHVAQLFLRDPELLILDEATSALDSKSEQIVQESLARLAKERTTVIVAHRLATVRAADLIVVMACGAVAESGTWSDLMAREGAFYDMVRRQALSLPAAEAA